MNTPRQNGFALLVAMIALVVITIAGVALTRSVDTGVLVAGNLAFRQSAVHAGDAGIEAARTWLIANKALIRGTANSPDDGYYGYTHTSFDFTGNNPALTNKANWEGTTGVYPKCLPVDANGNTVCYIIQKACDPSHPDTRCATNLSTGEGNSFGSLVQMTTYAQPSASEVTDNYFRVTARISGPRNTTAFVQTYLIISAS